MAITKIHAIQATVNKAVDYICNPAKTDESILISSFGCSPETAAFDFKFALSKTNQADPNKAFHLIQAFMPGEVSYKEAHQIGIELADKLLEGKYSYIVATHIDKGHVHNHHCVTDTRVNHGQTAPMLSPASVVTFHSMYSHIHAFQTDQSSGLEVHQSLPVHP